MEDRSITVNVFPNVKYQEVSQNQFKQTISIWLDKGDWPDREELTHVLGWEAGYWGCAIESCIWPPENDATLIGYQYKD
jgi:hypothetical protein